MHASHWRAQKDAPGVAYGFFEGELNGRPTLFHTGDSGDHSLVLLLPDEHVGLYFVFSGTDEQTVCAGHVCARVMGVHPELPYLLLSPRREAATRARRSTPALLARDTVRCAGDTVTPRLRGSSRGSASRTAAVLALRTTRRQRSSLSAQVTDGRRWSVITLRGPSPRRVLDRFRWRSRERSDCIVPAR